LALKSSTKPNLLLIAATLGFFLLNFPLGKLFMGDGGAYFIGFMYYKFVN
jgi:UDP-N-acetylmuramyl pentapeptide phosphotransferase/UDP-N-acetylglucosamine-1-phosphate transferase